MSGEESCARAMLKEDPLSTNKEGNAVPPEADSGKTQSGKAKPVQSSETKPKIQRPNGSSDRETQMQPNPVADDEHALADHSIEECQINSDSEEAISDLDEMLSNPVTLAAEEVFSEVDESPDVDEKKVPDRSTKKMSYSQSRWLIAAPKDGYSAKFNLFDSRLPPIQQTSVVASSPTFVKLPGWFPSVRTDNTYERPIGVNAAAAWMLNSANCYNNSNMILPGHKRPREGQYNLADQVRANGFPSISNLSGSDSRSLTTHPTEQVLGAQSQTPSTSFRVNGSYSSFSNIQPSSAVFQGYASPNMHFEVNRTRNSSFFNPAAPQIPSWYAQGQSLLILTQNHSNIHPPGLSSTLAPSDVTTYALRVPVPVTNSMYDPHYEQLGLPIDPFLRAFLEYSLGNNTNNNSLG